MRPEEDISSLGTGVTDGCELPCERWDSNQGPLNQKSVLLTAERLSSSCITVLDSEKQGGVII